jgi:uncharacterized membrane protein
VNLSHRLQLSRRITLLSYAGLLAALITGWASKDPSVNNLGVLLIQTLPLLVFLPGLLRRNSMVLLWMSCVLLLYIIKAVLNVSLGIDVLFAALESTFSITLFTATMLFVRYSRITRLEQAR